MSLPCLTKYVLGEASPLFGDLPGLQGRNLTPFMPHGVLVACLAVLPSHQ
jgi:hypothetical protein